MSKARRSGENSLGSSFDISTNTVLLYFAPPCFVLLRSFQKFGNDVNKLCEAIKLPIHATVYHPEDVDEDKRCPVGCLVMEVGAVQTNM